MNEFRQALDAHVGGQLALAELQRVLTLGLTRQPQMAAAHSAYIEAVYRSGRIPGESYLVLIEAVRAFQQSQFKASGVPQQAATPGAGDRTQFKAPDASQPAAPPSAGDKTQFKRPAAAAQPATPPSSAGDATQFRAPRAPASAAPATPPANEGSAGGAGSASPRGMGPIATGTAATGGTGSASPTGAGLIATGAIATGGTASASPTGTGPIATGPTGSRPTGSNWNDPSLWAGDAVAPGPGSVIKDRFVLEEELGRGGMGIVFKARDLRKEEAQDRNPYVALKLLNDEFRRHPESLKALQREARKAQHLAHANVVTVYDFDRDGANVFMVMELLEGQSLDRIIRDAEETGVGLEQALRLTRGLCRAMAYAHEQGVVHSDFKPANAFLTKSGVVKVFDFGIARAVKRQDNLTGSTTLFDPGTLGALTPTYASCEMIDGLEPDPRDDVYAMACVTYELITGQHPFNRLSATQARDKKMVAKRPRGLKRNQWKALRRGLAFKREERTASALQFMNELLPRPGRPTAPIVIGAAVLAIVVIAGTLVPGYLAKRRERALIDAIANAKGAELDALVAQLQALTPEQRAAILLNERARAGLINLFEERINAATDSNGVGADYPRARSLLEALQAFLPDSLAVRDLQDRLVARENDEIKRLSDQFDDHLRKGLLIDAQGPQNVGTVLAAIRRIDAENRLLRDPRLPGAFAEYANKALGAGDATLAQSLVVAGLSFDAQDATLKDLRDQAERVIGKQQLVARAQLLESSLNGLLDPQVAFADIESKRAEIGELRSIVPDSSVLARIQQRAQRDVGDQIASLSQQGQHAQALELVARDADLLAPSFVDQQRERLMSAQGAADARAAAVTQLKGRLDSLLATSRTDADWGGRFEQELRRLAAYVPAGDPYVVEIKSRAADAYLAQARELRSAQRLAEAGRMVDQARAYAPKSAAVTAEDKLLSEARVAREASAQQKNRLAQLEALKQKLLVQARANEVSEALASFEELRANLQKDDAYLTKDAPDAIGGAYLRLASMAAKDGRYANAVTLVGRAGEVAPTAAGLAAAQERYTRYQAIDRTLQSAGSIDVAATRGELERLARSDANEVAAVKQRLARDFVARIRSSTDAAASARLTAIAQELFAGEPALKNLSAAPKEEKQSPTGTSPPAPTTTGAAVSPAPVDQAASRSDRPAGSAASTPATSGGTQVAMVRPTDSANQVDEVRVPPDIACSAKLAGYGRRKQAVCYDTFKGGGRGPDLVVIPTGGPSAKAFAIGRTEVSNGDFALYCGRTGACKAPQGPAEYPVTGISLEDAQHYLAWISSVSGAVYRLPTDEEWTYAVGSQGGDRSSVNCTVEIGGKKVRGVALEPVQSGSASNWGLYNYLGNAQEWAVGSGFVAARGGAFSDNMSQCAPTASKPHSGAADAVTGLRVVREIE